MFSLLFFFPWPKYWLQYFQPLKFKLKYLRKIVAKENFKFYILRRECRGNYIVDNHSKIFDYCL